VRRVVEEVGKHLVVLRKELNLDAGLLRFLCAPGAQVKSLPAGLRAYARVMPTKEGILLLFRVRDLGVAIAPEGRTVHREVMLIDGQRVESDVFFTPTVGIEKSGQFTLENDGRAGTVPWTR
jgi:hypothetical protein